MRNVFALIIVPLLLALTTPAFAAVSIVDDMGRTVTLQKPAARIIPLYAAFTDILTAMGEKSRIIARTKTDTLSGLPENLPVIGTHMRPNLELVLAAKPDLVLQMGGRAEAAQSIAALEKHGIPTAFFRIATFTDLFSVIDRLGTLTHREAAARESITALRARLDVIAATIAAADRKRPSVFFEVRYPNLLGAGPESLVTDIIRAAGGANVLAPADAPGKYAGRVVRLSEEELIRLAPDCYLVQSGPMNKNPVPLTDRPHFAVLHAVQVKRTATVDEHVFSRPGPKAVDAVAILARLLYPDLFPAPRDNAQEISQ